MTDPSKPTATPTIAAWMLGIAAVLTAAAIVAGASAVLAVARLEVRVDTLERAALPTAELQRQLGKIEGRLDSIDKQLQRLEGGAR